MSDSTIAIIVTFVIVDILLNIIWDLIKKDKDGTK